ncbi:DUF493 domain-containing protein [Algoriphagus namhaensis]
MKKQFDTQEFKQKLEASGGFPMLYMFKFILPKGQENQIEDIFPRNKVEFKESSGGKYVSSTIRIMAESADQVIGYYQEASKIEGIISL